MQRLMADCHFGLRPVTLPILMQGSFETESRRSDRSDAVTGRAGV